MCGIIVINRGEKEIENIKAHSFDKGWRYGLAFEICIFLIMIIAAVFLK